MKGDEGVQVFEKASYCPLFVNVCPWNRNCFHSIDVDTPAITDSVDMRLQVRIDESFRPEIEVIEIRVDTIASEGMVCGTNQTTTCCLLKPSFERTKMDDEVIGIDGFVV